MITTERMQEITVALTMRTEPELSNNEEREFAESVKGDVEFVRKNGGQIHIPAEWEVDTDDDETTDD